MYQPRRGLTLRGRDSGTDRGGFGLPGEGTTVLWGALLEEFDPGLRFVAGEAVRWPPRVLYADHSRLEHHGASAGHVGVVLLRALEQACIGFGPRMCEVSSVGARQRTRECSPRGLGGVFALVQGLYTSPCLVALLGWPSSVFFSRHRHSFQPALAFFVLAQ